MGEISPHDLHLSMASLQTPVSRPAVEERTEMVRVLVDSLADRGLTNAQMINAREIVKRLNPERFHVSMFHMDKPDPEIAARPSTRLIHLPQRLRTFLIFHEYARGDHDILFYLKPAPASRWYMRLRRKWNDHRPIIGSVEAQCDYHNEPSTPARYVRIWERTILQADYIFSNCTSVKNSLQREYGRASEVVPTGVNTNFFTPEWDRPANARLRVLFVGSLRRFKGPHVVVEAAALFPDADFIIAGTGPMIAELRQRVAMQRLENFYFAGLLDREQVRKELQRADVFFFPSRWEGSPRVVLEAGACGLPVVARKDYGLETVIDGETGFLASSDEEAIMRVGELLCSPDLRRKFGLASRRHTERFDWSPIVRRWEEIFLAVTSKKGASRVP